MQFTLFDFSFPFSFSILWTRIVLLGRVGRVLGQRDDMWYDYDTRLITVLYNLLSKGLVSAVSLIDLKSEARICSLFAMLLLRFGSEYDDT